MSISEMQACLARLYVDAPSRRLFELDSDSLLGEYTLTDDERGAILALDRKMLNMFAGSLITKSMKLFKLGYPMLFKIDEAVMVKYYRRYYHLYPAKPEDSSVGSILIFGKFLEDSLAVDEAVPAYTSNVARFERHFYAAKFSPTFGDGDASDEAVDIDGSELTDDEILVSVPRMRSGVAVVSFEYDMAAFESSLQDDVVPEAVDAGDYYFVFRRERPGRVRTFQITQGSKSMLDRCDGEKTTAQIVAELEEHFGQEGLAAPIVKTVRTLLKSTVLEF